MIDIETIAAISITVNLILTWLWYRRAELIGAAIAVKDAIADNNVSEVEYQNILAHFEAVAEKK